MNIWMDLFYTFSQVWFVDCLCWFVFTGATMCVLVWNDFFTTGFTLLPKSRFVVFLYAGNLSCLCSFQTITIPLIRMKNRLFTSMSGYDRYWKSEIWYCTLILWRSKWNGSHHRPKKNTWINVDFMLLYTLEQIAGFLITLKISSAMREK